MISRPSTTRRHTMPVSTMEAASEPASGLVSPKHGTSLPSARRGNQ